jgi:Na+/H+ antiporter NhaD/arsenite permease-like protein
MSLAVLSVSALALAIIVSCVTTLNVGVLAVALAWIIGVYVGGMPVAAVMSGFPSQLFLTLTGMTLLFSLAQCNGTLDRLAHQAVRSCRGNRGAIPVMFFVLAAALASMGPGNIATAAILAPMAMATADRIRIPLFLMAIMVGNGSNAGSLSPFAPTGIIVNGLMARSGMVGFEMPTYLYNLGAHAIVAFGGYFLLGGLKLFAQRSTVEAVATFVTRETSRSMPWAFSMRAMSTVTPHTITITRHGIRLTASPSSAERSSTSTTDAMNAPIPTLTSKNRTLRMSTATTVSVIQCRVRNVMSSAGDGSISTASTVERCANSFRPPSRK